MEHGVCNAWSLSPLQQYQYWIISFEKELVFCSRLYKFLAFFSVTSFCIGCGMDVCFWEERKREVWIFRNKTLLLDHSPHNQQNWDFRFRLTAVIMPEFIFSIKFQTVFICFFFSFFCLCACAHTHTHTFVLICIYTHTHTLLQVRYNLISQCTVWPKSYIRGESAVY